METNDNGMHSERNRRSAVRIAVHKGAMPEDWQSIRDRIDRRVGLMPRRLIKAAAGLATLAGLLAVAATVVMGIWYFYPDISPYFLACFVLPPAILAGGAAGQFGGNLLLRVWFGIGEASRRGFATRLTLTKAPESWPAPVRRWLFTGDWLGSPVYDLRLPYVRIFVEGYAPATCADEDELWREIHGLISGDSLWEAGSNHREISYPRQLPSWAREVEKGDGFADLKKRIGADTAGQWVGHLWRRACRQWPGLGGGEFPADARRECFEAHSLSLSRGREALVVVLRPSSFVAEMDLEESGRGELAA